MSLHLSVVIPAFNEDAVLSETLLCLRRYLAAQPWASEVIVVDDGSTDGTPPLLESFRGEFACLRVLRHAKNQGKGASLRDGILASRGKFVLLTDADLPAQPEDIPRLLDPLYRGKAVAIGSRRLAMPAPCAGAVLRLAVSKAYRRLARGILRLPVRDTQCGFKALAREGVAPIVDDLRQRGYSFDAELIFAAHAAGLSTEEVEVSLIERRKKIRCAIVLQAPQMFLDLFRIRFGGAHHGRPVLADHRVLTSASEAIARPAMIHRG